MDYRLDRHCRWQQLLQTGPERHPARQGPRSRQQRRFLFRHLLQHHRQYLRHGNELGDSNYQVLQTDTDPNFVYMGVGFDRGNGARTTNPAKIPVSANPLNLVGKDGKPLADVRKGYVIKDDRVILGIPNDVN